MPHSIWSPHWTLANLCEMSGSQFISTHFSKHFKSFSTCSRIWFWPPHRSVSFEINLHFLLLDSS
jgi:hypothetical protein